MAWVAVNNAAPSTWGKAILVDIQTLVGRLDALCDEARLRRHPRPSGMTVDVTGTGARIVISAT